MRCCSETPRVGLRTGESRSAIGAAQATLEKEPRRFRSLYGAAHAAQLGGRRSVSRKHFRDLLEVCAHSDQAARPELEEARRAILQK
jgi:hypothetical protein